MNNKSGRLLKVSPQCVTRRALKKFGGSLTGVALAWLLIGQAHSADLYVDAGVTTNGDGTAARPYWRITEAIQQARLLRQTAAIPSGERIIIHVAPGAYLGSKENPVLNQNPRYEALPILVNVPNLTLAGATVLTLDARGLPTGMVPATETLVKTVDHLGSWIGDSVILISRTTDGSIGHDVTVSGLHLDQPDDASVQSPNIFVDRVSGFKIQANVFTHGFGALNAQQASGTIEGNLMFDTFGPGVFASGGSVALPAALVITRNRAVNSEGGLMLSAVVARFEPHVGANDLEIVSQQATFDRDDLPQTMLPTVVNNDFSQNVAFGMRLVCLPVHATGGNDVKFDPKDGVHGVMVATVTDNLVNDNGHYGISVDAAFADRNNKRPDSFFFSGTFQGNQLAGNRQAGFLFAFISIWVEANAKPLDKDNDSLKFFKYLQNSTYDVTVLDDEATGFDYDNQVVDPLDGTVLNNTLIVNGMVIAPGRKITPVTP